MLVIRVSFVVNSISVPVTPTLSASAAPFAPASASASKFVSVYVAELPILTRQLPRDESFDCSREVYITSLCGHFQGGARSGIGQTSRSANMIVINTTESFVARMGLFGDKY